MTVTPSTLSVSSPLDQCIISDIMRSIRNAVVLNFSAQLPKSEAIFSINCRKNEMIARFVFTKARRRHSLSVTGPSSSALEASVKVVKDADRR